MRRLLIVTAATLLTTQLAGPARSASAASDGSSTLTELVARSGGEFDFNYFDGDILLNAVLTAGLADALDDESADLTLFAPNDLAFVLLARDLGYEGIDEQGSWEFLVAALTDLGGGDPIPVLTDILLYHVAPESLTAIDVIFSSSVDTLLGATFRPFFIFLRDNEPDLRDPALIIPNVAASNGILHVISRVLIPIDLP